MFRDLSRSGSLWILLGLIGVTSTLLGCAREAPIAPLPSDAELRDRIDQALDYTYANRHLDMNQQAAWQIVHGLLVFGKKFEVYHDGKLVPALDYLFKGGQLKGWNLRKGDHGLETIVEAGSKTGQGHEDQWLGYLSQCGLSPDEKIIVNGETFTVADLITQAQWDIYDGMEATWTLMAFSTYLPLDAEWTAKDGSKWNLPRIVGMEAAQRVEDGACGGTHRLYALSIAVDRHLAEGGRLEGSWKAADERIRWAIQKAHDYQQRDGSFSTNFFERPGTSPDLDKRMGSSGHILEFLTVALTDDELKQPWVKHAVCHLVDLLERSKELNLECGGLYHSVHALDIYRKRRFGQRPIGGETVAAETGNPAGTNTSKKAAADSPGRPSAAAARTAGG